MALQDYSLLNEEDFYGQLFEHEGLVSVWVGSSSLEDAPKNLDVLQDYCGVGYYSPDDSEAFNIGFSLCPICELLTKLSFSESFSDAVAQAAVEADMASVRWVIVQYDFAYDPANVKRPLNAEAVFLGAFPYSAT